MIERQIEVTTPEGEMTTFVFHPEHGGPFPVVLYLMDAPSIRPALKDMASRLATAGYYVLLPYLFYRGGPFREFGTSDEDMHARQELMGTVTPSNIVTDAAALLAVVDDDPAARDGKVGAVGFCMSGGLAMSLARAMPERVAAAASIHGAWLVRDTADSPHPGLDPVQAELYFAWCDGGPDGARERHADPRGRDEGGRHRLHDRLPHRRRPRLRPGRAALPPRGVGAALGARPRAPPAQPLNRYARVASSSTATPLRRL